MFKNIFSSLSIKSGVVIVARLGDGLAGVRLPAWTKNFILLQNVHTGRRIHPFSRHFTVFYFLLYLGYAHSRLLFHTNPKVWSVLCWTIGIYPYSYREFRWIWSSEL